MQFRIELDKKNDIMCTSHDVVEITYPRGGNESIP